VVGGTAARAGEEADDEVIRRLLAAAAVLLMVPLSAEPLKVINREEATIRRMATRFAETWNAHDMDAMAVLFADDADFVSVGGVHLKRRQQIRDEHATLHQMQFKGSTLTVEGVTVRFLKPDVALAHIDWRIEGDRDPDGTSRAPRTGVMSWVVVRKANEWRIASSHNTNVRETPLAQ
jgi:uncharacterized protein (TIGR02246 family)